MAEYIMDSAKHCVSAMESGAIVVSLPNGKMKRYEFTKEQTERMRKNENDSRAVFYSMQEM